MLSKAVPSLQRLWLVIDLHRLNNINVPPRRQRTLLVRHHSRKLRLVYVHDHRQPVIRHRLQLLLLVDQGHDLTLRDLLRRGLDLLYNHRRVVPTTGRPFLPQPRPRRLGHQAVLHRRTLRRDL